MITTVQFKTLDDLYGFYNQGAGDRRGTDPEGIPEKSLYFPPLSAYTKS